MTATQGQLRRLETFCFVVQWVLVGCTVWFGLGALWLRERPSFPDLATESPDSPTTESAGLRRSLEELAGIWKRDLRQTLIEPPPKDTPRPKPAPAPPPVELPKLLATFSEEGRSWALFADKRGAQRVHSTSDRIDDFDIIGVLPGAAELKRGDTEYQVKVPIRAPEERAKSRTHRGRIGT